MRPVSSARGMNSPGAMQPALRVLPAHERLEAGERAGLAATTIGW